MTRSAPSLRASSGVPRAHDGGHVELQVLGQLDGEGADSSRCSVDEHPAARSGLRSGDAQHRGGRREWQSSSLLERDAVREGGQLVGRCASVLGERADAFAEHCVARSPPGGALPDRLHDAGQIGAPGRDTGPTGSEGRPVEEAG